MFVIGSGCLVLFGNKGANTGTINNNIITLCFARLIVNSVLLQTPKVN